MKGGFFNCFRLCQANKIIPTIIKGRKFEKIIFDNEVIEKTFNSKPSFTYKVEVVSSNKIV